MCFVSCRFVSCRQNRKGRFPQRLAGDEELLSCNASVYAEKPQKDIHSFIGKLSHGEGEESLGIENTVWCGAVVASGVATGLVVYTGAEARAAMNNSQPRSKVSFDIIFTTSNTSTTTINSTTTIFTTSTITTIFTTTTRWA